MNEAEERVSSPMSVQNGIQASPLEMLRTAQAKQKFVTEKGRKMA